MTDQLTATEQLLLPYLPSQAILGQMMISTLIAFVVVQMIKGYRRDSERRALRRSEMALHSVLVTFFLLTLSLGIIQEQPIAQALVYALEGALLSPLTITVLLHLLGKFAPGLRAQLSQNRRRNSQPYEGGERRTDSDDPTSTRFM